MLAFSDAALLGNPARLSRLGNALIAGSPAWRRIDCRQRFLRALCKRESQRRTLFLTTSTHNRHGNPHGDDDQPRPQQVDARLTADLQRDEWWVAVADWVMSSTLMMACPTCGVSKPNWSVVPGNVTGWRRAPAGHRCSRSG